MSMLLTLRGRIDLQVRGLRCKDRRNLRLQVDVISVGTHIVRESPEEALRKINQQRQMGRSRDRREVSVGNQKRELQKDLRGHPAKCYMNVKYET